VFSAKIQASENIFTLNVFDTKGSIVKRIEKVQLPFKYDAAELDSGIYFVKLVSGKNCYTGKLIVFRQQD
jgi:hypothetical protein